MNLLTIMYVDLITPVIIRIWVNSSTNTRVCVALSFNLIAYYYIFVLSEETKTIKSHYRNQTNMNFTTSN